MALARLALLALGSLRQPQHDYRRDHRNQRAVIRSFGQAVERTLLTSQNSVEHLAFYLNFLLSLYCFAVPVPEQGSRQLGMQRLVPEVGHLLEPV